MACAQSHRIGVHSVDHGGFFSSQLGLGSVATVIVHPCGTDCRAFANSSTKYENSVVARARQEGTGHRVEQGGSSSEPEPESCPPWSLKGGGRMQTGFQESWMFR